MTNTLALPPQFTLTARGLQIHGKPTYAEYEALCAWLGRKRKSLKRKLGVVQLVIGDALLYGEWTYGTKYAQAATRFKIPAATLEVYQWVAARSKDCRLPGLTYSHYRKVASMKDEPAKRNLLAEAANLKLSANKLGAARGLYESKTQAKRPPTISLENVLCTDCILRLGQHPDLIIPTANALAELQRTLKAKPSLGKDVGKA